MRTGPVCAGTGEQEGDICSAVAGGAGSVTAQVGVGNPSLPQPRLYKDRSPARPPGQPGHVKTLSMTFYINLLNQITNIHLCLAHIAATY